MSGNPIVEAVEKVNEAFDEYKKVNDERLDAESKGNDAKARELGEKLERIEVDIAASEKAKKDAERKQALIDERIDILEAANDRPTKSVEENVKNEYKEHFLTFMRSGMTDQDARQGMKNAEVKSREMKAVNIGTAADGGHAVPEELSRSIDKLMLRQSDILQNVKMVQVGSSDYKELLTINRTTATWVDETTTRTENTAPELRQITPTWGELYSYLFATQWSLEDMFFNVEEWLVDNVSEQMAKSLDLSIWSGNGSSKPTGLTNGAPTAVADHASPMRAAAILQYVPTDSASPQAVGGDDVFDLVYSLGRSYRPNAKFGANQNTQAALRKLKDSTGQYLWEPSMQVGQPARLVGYELFTYEDMADPTTGDGLYLGFGDWRKAYTLPYRTQLAITIDNNITAPGYVKFYVRRRYGGIVANNDALKLLKLADT